MLIWKDLINCSEKSLLHHQLQSQHPIYFSYDPHEKEAPQAGANRQAAPGNAHIEKYLCTRCYCTCPV